jgi:tetratricopeptide (TPR) repeat protein
LVAATAPIALIGLGLMLYNALRFDSPFEFGWRYQLAGEEQLMRRMFSLHFLWFNFRIYFLEPARWSAHFPFVHARLLPSVPAGHEHEMECFGVLTTVPLVWLALAAPLAWRNRSGSTDPALGWFLTAAALQFGICALTLGLICCAGVRYELDFLPALVLLAVIGILGLERAVATPGAAVTHRPVRRRLVRWGWSLLLAFSVVFNLFVSVARSAQAHDNFGAFLLRVGRTQEAFEQYQQALRLRPDDAEAHNNLGGILEQMGQMSVAVGYYKEAVRLNPYYFQARSSLGLALAQQGMMREAIEQFEAALRIRPDDAETHYDLGLALAQESRIPEAIEQFKQVLRVRPDDFDAHNGLGAALAQVGRMPEAIEQFEQVLRIKPDYAEAHYNVGIALEKTGRVPEAIQHYEQALRLRPDLAAARNALARLQGSQ